MSDGDLSQATDYTVMPMPERFATGTDPESTIRRMLWRYPSIFQTRSDALKQLFLSYGNGYEWSGGHLVEVWREECDDKPSDEVHEDPEGLPGVFTKLRAERDAEYAAVRSDIERAATTKGPLRFKLRIGHYSRTYSYLWNAPDDISPAWSAALAEAREMFEPMIGDFERRAEEFNRERRPALLAERKAIEQRLREIDQELRSV